MSSAPRAADPAASTATYSDLMADSQALVAEETLRLVDLRGIARLHGCRRRHRGIPDRGRRARIRDLRLTLFDLPAVVAAAPSRLAAPGWRIA